MTRSLTLTPALRLTWRGESIRTIAAGVKVSIGVVHKTLADTQHAAAAAENDPR